MNVKRVVIKPCQNPKALAICTIDSRARNTLTEKAKSFGWLSHLDSVVTFPHEDVLIVAENYETKEVKTPLENLQLPKKIGG